MINNQNKEKIDRLIAQAEEILTALDRNKQEIKKAYRDYFRSPEAAYDDEDYSAVTEEKLPEIVSSYMKSIISNLNQIGTFNLDNACTLTKRLEDMIQDYIGNLEIMFDEHIDVASWHDIFEYEEWLEEYRTIDLLTRFANIDENIVLIGGNGSGKSTLAQLLKGNDSARITVIPAQKLMFFLAENEALATRLDDVESQLLNNNIESSKSEEDYGFTDYQEHQFTRLIIAMREEYFHYLRTCDERGLTPEHNSCIYYKVKNIIKAVFKDVELLIGDNLNELVCCKKGNSVFTINGLSEGEKAALYYSMSVVMANKNSFVVIDEPETFLNPALANKLWDMLIRERSDCQFIFITHSVNFTLARSDARIIWIKSFTYPDKFTFEEVTEKYTLPKQLMTEILGSKCPVLFCEGDDKTSIDYKVYNALFHDTYTVIPVGGHKEVVNYCKVLNNADWIGIEAKGIVDGDLRSPEEINRLKLQNIVVLPVNEIEMLLLDEDVLEATIKGSHPQKYMSIIEDFTKAFWETVTEEKEQMALCKLKKQVDGYLDSKKIEKFDNIANVKRDLQKISEFDVEAMLATNRTEIDQIIEMKDYGRLLNVCNLKQKITRGLADRVFGKKYVDKAIEYIITDEALQNTLLKKYFINIINDNTEKT